MLKCRRKKLVDKNAPSKPLNSYNLFFQRRIQQIKEKNLGLANPEVIKMISVEWSNLPDNEKSNLKKEADNLKAEYEKSMTEYRKTKNYKDFMNKLKEHNNKMNQAESKKKPGKQDNCIHKEDNNMDSLSSDQHIPIFTNEFLEHNKQRETTLRQLRKQSTQLEEETALLSKHVESLEASVKNINQESELYQSKLNQLEDIVNNMRTKIAKCLGDLIMPTTRERISTSTVEEFLQTVAQFEEKNEHSEFVSQVKEKLACIEFQ